MYNILVLDYKSKLIGGYMAGKETMSAIKNLSDVEFSRISELAKAAPAPTCHCSCTFGGAGAGAAKAA